MIDITVILATFNRSAILRQTLENFTRLNLENLRVEFVVVDNNSVDETQKVLTDFRDRLPLNDLFESKAGKNCALNKALADAPLGEIVVFTDDDINPQDDWLQVIWDNAQRWPEMNVFGGRIEPAWPTDSKIPQWIQCPGVKALGFSWQDFGPDEVEYNSNQTPFGPNMWLRRTALANGRRFNEAIGPNPQKRSMGDEMDFMNALRADSHKLLYVPTAMVHHHVEAKDVNMKNICRRAIYIGRGVARIDGICRKDFLKNHPILWYLIRFAGTLSLGLRTIGLNCLPLNAWRAGKSIYAYKWFGYNIEVLMMAIDDI